MIKVVFFDIDGTLVSHTDTTVSESTRRSIQELQEKGIQCVIATGRHFVEMEFLPVNDLVNNKVFDGYVALNGQLCCDRDRNVIYKNTIKGDSKEKLIQRFEAMKEPTVLLESDRIYLNFSNEDVERGQAAISSPVPDIGTYEGADIYQAFAYGGKEIDEPLRQLLPDCKIARWCEYAADINDAMGSKMYGIQKYLEHIGVTREETMAFGDGENDIEMLQFVQIGVAMGNADPEVKEVADYVTDSVDEDGIRNALLHFGLV